MRGILAIIIVLLAQDPEEVILRVGDREVTRGEYSSYLLEKVGRQALDRFVTDLLVKAEAEKRGIQVTPEEREAWIEKTIRESRENPDFFPWLRSQGLDLEAYRKDYLPAEAEIQLLIQKMIRAERLTDEGIRDLFEEKHGVRHRVRVILVREDGILREAMADWARRRVREAKTLLEEGEPFEDLVRSHSEAPDADLGGDLGFFGRGRFDPAFEEAAFSLEVGEVAGPVETDFGYHLIQVMDKREGKVRARHILVRSFRALDRDPDASALMEKRLGPELKKEIIETARRKADGILEDLRLGADFGTLATQESSHWSASRSGEIPPFREGRGPLPPEVARVVPDLQEKGVSGPIQADLGWYLVRLDGREGGDRTFEEVEASLREEARSGEISPMAVSRFAEKLREGVEITRLGELAE